ncbi:hypothetical protein EW093_11000 [Thiospirochaeta perfilievii]|uniref:Uncharacterized protein n=1 Tax=Thiospirochaeta perfilievii TaxID=252967 RepID=A0A5C1QAY3_9SPIO|nr:hypothetical protein [Thiospirochaeta perfilievii]QEN05215.1 hypothetical protein EW093_11000 [Thiospirochaeta perfilievii]
MKRILLLSLISFYLYSGDLSTYNLKIVSSIKKNNQNITTINTINNKQILVKSDKTLTLEQEEIIGRTYNTFYNWPEMDISTSNMEFEDNILSTVINVSNLNYNGVEISQYMPSGIQIYYDTFYEYDFRMFKDTLFMRLKGQYFSKKEFLDELLKAVNDPILYVQIHDPAYLIKQIASLRDENLEQTDKISTLIDNYTNLLKMHNELLNKHSLLKEEVELDKIAQTKLKNGVISLNNKSLFGSLNEFDSTLVDEVISLKEGNPGIKVEDIELTLKEKDIKYSTKVIESIFIIYFNEFPQNE